MDHASFRKCSREKGAHLSSSHLLVVLTPLWLWRCISSRPSCTSHNGFGSCYFFYLSASNGKCSPQAGAGADLIPSWWHYFRRWGKLGVERRKWVTRRGATLKQILALLPSGFFHPASWLQGGEQPPPQPLPGGSAWPQSQNNRSSCAPKPWAKTKSFLVLLGYRHRDRKCDQHTTSTFFSQGPPRPSRSRAHYKNVKPLATNRPGTCPVALSCLPEVKNSLVQVISRNTYWLPSSIRYAKLYTKDSKITSKLRGTRTMGAEKLRCVTLHSTILFKEVGKVF